MFRFSLKSLNPAEYITFPQLSSRTTRLLIALVAGFSVSILTAGYLLQRRRRRYRAIQTTLQRSSTFGSHSRESSFPCTPNHTPQQQDVKCNGKLNESYSSSAVMKDKAMEGDGEEEEEKPVTQTESYILDTHHVSSEAMEETGEDDQDDFMDGRESLSSDDSFHSTLDVVELSGVASHQLYLAAKELVASGGVRCRKMRTKLLCCHDDQDFLSKVHCVRLAFDNLVQSESNRSYFVELGKELMAGFLRSSNQDPTHFIQQFDNLTGYMEELENWEVARKELTSRNVECMNVYDIALDFILLDAFDDLDNPPSAIVAVLQNRWITPSMKTSALSAAIWSISKAKKSMLKEKNGFMAKFYSLSETISPTLAWGFLGTDDSLRAKCNTFRTAVQDFTRSIFSLEKVRYTSIATLSDDILDFAKQTAHSMDTSLTDTMPHGDSLDAPFMDAS